MANKTTVQIPVVGKFYKVSMPGETEFGCCVKIDSVVGSVITTHVENDNYTIVFDVRDGRVFYRAVSFDIFLSAEVTFKEVK